MADAAANTVCLQCQKRPAEASGYCRSCAEALRQEIFAAMPLLKEREEAAKTKRLKEHWRYGHLRAAGQQSSGGSRQINEYLFSASEVCPVCEQSFTLAKVYWSRLRAKSHAADFYTEYYDFSPYPYVVWVCGHCGYGAPMQVFHELTALERQAIKEGFGGRPPRGTFHGERDLQQTESAYKLALFSTGFRRARYGADVITGSLWLRLAWIYREAGQKEQEGQCLQKAAQAYEKAFVGDVPLTGELTRPKLEYLIGELYRRSGHLETASRWLGRILGRPEVKAEPQVEKLVRQQWQVLRREIKEGPQRDP